MRRIPSAGTAISRAAAAEIPSRMHRLDRAQAALAALLMSMRPRTQTAIIIARLRSKTARILHSIKNLLRLRRLLHRRILYSPPPKRWRAHSLKLRLPELASSRTPHGKQPYRPAPDVRRAMWQRQRTIQRPRQENLRQARRIITQKLRSPSWTAGARRICSRNRPYIPNQNPIRAAAQQCRIAAGLFCPARQEKRQAKIHRAVPVSRPAAQESRITAAIHRGSRYRPNPHSSAAPLCSRLTHSGAHRIQPRPMQRQTLRLRRLALRAARHSLSAAQEKVRCSLRIQKLRSSAVPLRRLRTWQPHSSQQQNIRLLRFLRDPVWQEIRLCRTSAYSQHLHQAVRQENSQILIPHRPAIPQEMVRGRSNRAAHRMRQHPVRQERSARPSADAIPSPCSRRHAFPRMEIPRSHSRIMFLPSSPAARCSRPAEPAWTAALQIGSIPRPRCRYPRQRRLPTAKPVHPRARPRGLMQRVQQNSELRSAQCPRKAAAQKSRRRRLLRIRLPLLPNGRAGNRLPQLLWAA